MQNVNVIAATADIASISASLGVIAGAGVQSPEMKASAAEFNRVLHSLAANAATFDRNAAELERLVFGDLKSLAPAVEDIARLAPPEAQKLEPGLRQVFIADDGTWRVEAVPKRMMAGQDFISAVSGLGAPPLGPMVHEVEKAEVLKMSFLSASLAGLLLLLAISFAYLRSLLEWLIVMLSAMMPLPIFAAFIVSAGMTVTPVAITALQVTLISAVSMAILTLREEKLQLAQPVILFPAAALMAILLPVLLLQLPEIQEFARILIVLLVFAILANVTVVTQLNAWLMRYRDAP
jgi:hypothetical protein